MPHIILIPPISCGRFSRMVNGGPVFSASVYISKKKQVVRTLFPRQTPTGGIRSGYLLLVFGIVLLLGMNLKTFPFDQFGVEYGFAGKCRSIALHEMDDRFDRRFTKTIQLVI